MQHKKISGSLRKTSKDLKCNARGHAQGSAGATHSLKDGDEADTADRDRTAAVPVGWGARQRKERERERESKADIATTSVKRPAEQARGRGLCDLVRAWQDQRTYTGCGHEARSARGHAQGSAGATDILRDGDEADTADREMTAAVPAGYGAR